MKTRHSKESVISEFCNFIWEARKVHSFTLQHLQGGMRFVSPGIPSEQRYADLLATAIEEGWVRPETGKPNSYLCMGGKKGWWELQSLKDRLLLTSRRSPKYDTAKSKESTPR